MTGLGLWTLLGLAQAADLRVGATQPYTTVGQAIAAASSGDRILIDPGTYNEVGFGINGLQLTLEADQGPGTVTYRHASTGSWLRLDLGADITWLGIDFEGQGNGRFASVTGGARLVVEDALISGCDVVGQGTGTGTGTGLGGVAQVDGGELVLRRSTLSANAADEGAAIHALGSSVTVEDTRFEAHSATTLGTVICDGGALCSLSGAVFEGNTAPMGAALWVDGATTSSLGGSVVCDHGGDQVVRFEATSATVVETVFTWNTGLDGPLLLVDGLATAEVRNNHFVGAGGTAPAHAARLAGTVDFRNNLVVGNSGGGPALVAAPGTVTEAWNLFWDNSVGDADVALDPTTVAVDPQLGLLPNSCDVGALVPPNGSPAVDGGDPALTGPDGSRSDLGAFTSLSIPALTDADGDGFTADQDCNDADAAIFPGATEIPCDGIDQDCDPATDVDADADGDGVSVCDGDCDDTNPYRSQMYSVYVDQDMDGYGRGQTPTDVCGLPANASEISGDCDDTDPNTYPGAPEIPGDEKDNDCDGSLVVDNDGDGVGFQEDCADNNPNRFPGNPEIPGDGKDQDCDGYDGEEYLTGGSGAACGCATEGSATGWSWVLGLLVLARRRRR